MKLGRLLACLALVGCAPRQGPDQPAARVAPQHASASPAATPPASQTVSPTVESEAAEAPPAEPEPDATPATATKVKVPFDKPVLVVAGEGPTPIVYLHGRCGDPSAFLVWANAVRKHGTLISFLGDEKCKGGTRFKWSADTVALDRRITKAVAAVRAELGLPLDDKRRLVVGYSQGSLRAEALATRYPERYPRPMLIGGPRAPREESLTKSEAVLLLVGDHDQREHLREAEKKLKKRGNRVRYMELKDARHGEYGPEASAIMSGAFAWLIGDSG